jgi:subtilisin family serine protease
VAGNASEESVVGVAPGVTLGIYRIFDCNTETTSERIMNALRRAFQDGMDIVNLSLGKPSGHEDGPESMIVDEISRQGVIVTSAIGNRQEQGIWFAGAPAVAEQSTAVASFDNLKNMELQITVEGLDNPINARTFP